MDSINNLSEYTFGQLLKLLLNMSHQKSYLLASYLNYDVSYISKWVTGAMLPASKHAVSMCSGVANFIVENTEEVTVDSFYKLFEVDTPEDLRRAINQALIHAYQLSGEQKGKSKTILVSNENNSRTVVNPNLQKLYIKVNPKITDEGEEPVGLAMMIDLCALGKEDKMSIACADKGDRFFENINEIHYLLSLTDDTFDEKFDTLLLTYMLNSYADLNFIVSYYNHVPCSLMFAVQNYCMHMSVVAQNHRAILSDTSMDRGVANETYDTIISIEKSFSKRLVRESTMGEIIKDKEYLSFVISTNISLYLTKLDEFLLPDDVFEEILAELNIKSSDCEDLRNLHNTFKSSIEFSNIKIGLLERALQDYVIDGKLDFFGYPVVATVDQRERHLNYIKALMNSNSSNTDIRFIDPQGLADFDKNFAPCIYLSDCLGYIRLRGSNSSDKISIIETQKLMEVYNKFIKYTFSKENEGYETALVRITRMLSMLKK